jgi:hypothetical protein
MVVIHPSIDDSHHDIGTARRQVPGLGSVNIRAGDPALLSRVLQTPHLSKIGIVGDGVQHIDDVIRLGVLDVGIAAVLLEGGVEALVPRHSD